MWQETDNQLYKKFDFEHYLEGVEFINSVAQISEELNHHPDQVVLKWGTVEIWLCTHSEGNAISDKDHELSQKIDTLTLKENQLVTSEKPHNIAKAKLYTDGGSRGNPGPSASGVVILDMDDNVVKKDGEYLGITTNNQAEYQALKYGLEQAKELGVRELTVYMDSLLVVNQMNGTYKVKNRDLWPIHQAAKDLSSSFADINYVHVPRELNSIADGLVNDTLDANS